jgi:hypothetical protein
VVASDLTMYAYAEAIRIWEGSEIKILSVGTGITSNFTVNGEEAKSVCDIFIHFSKIFASFDSSLGLILLLVVLVLEYFAVFLLLTFYYVILFFFLCFECIPECVHVLTVSMV